MRKHLSLMLLLLLLITCTACGQRQTVQRMAADRITQAESVSQLQEVSDLIVVFTPESQENVLSYSVTAMSPAAIRGPPERYRRC